MSHYDCDPRSDAFDAGYLAAVAGESLEDNPHRWLSDLYNYWNSGFYHAANVLGLTIPDAPKEY